jgi:hypothetical protein
VVVVVAATVVVVCCTSVIAGDVEAALPHAAAINAVAMTAAAQGIRRCLTPEA